MVPTTSQVTTKVKVTKTTTTTTTTAKEELYTEDELFCMAAVIYNEAGSDSCSDTLRRYVGYVVLNRVSDHRFPDSIRGVIEQYGQYCGMEYGVRFASRHTNAGEAHAVSRAYRIAQELLENRNDVPIPSNVLFQAEFVQGVDVFAQIGNTYFCYAEEVN